MRGWRAVGVAAAVALLSILIVAGLLQFLAPDVAYYLKDRAAEAISGNRGRKIRIALGSSVGSSYRVGTILNRYLSNKAGYELELVVTSSPGNVATLLDSNQHIDLANHHSADDEAARGMAFGLRPGVAVLLHCPERRPVQDSATLRPDQPGVRETGAATDARRASARLLRAAHPRGGAPARAWVVRPKKGNVADFEAGHMAAATRTQFLHGDLIEAFFKSGRYRLAPIRDHEALARSIPGTRAASIPAGLYGPTRQIPAAPVPTVAVTMLLVARTDLPGRVARDLLDVIYDPRFARDLQFELTEDWGRRVAACRPSRRRYLLSRNDLLTSDRGRIVRGLRPRRVAAGSSCAAVPPGRTVRARAVLGSEVAN